MSNPTESPPPTPLIGLSVCTKEDEDHILGVVEDTESGTGNLIIRGNLDLRKYSVPMNVIISIDQSNDKIILDMTRDDLDTYERQP